MLTKPFSVKPVECISITEIFIENYIIPFKKSFHVQYETIIGLRMYI